MTFIPLRLVRVEGEPADVIDTITFQKHTLAMSIDAYSIRLSLSAPWHCV